jgi:hypothetical protein
MSKFRERAKAHFTRNMLAMEMDIESMLSDHSAAGRLQSGATITAALRIFEEHSHRALDAVLSETAKLVEHRGRRWTAAMADISGALEDHLATARSRLDRTFKIADRQASPSVARAIDEQLVEMGERLRTLVSDYSSGWTSPVPKPWKDRHPLIYAVVLLLIGALIGWAVQAWPPLR